MTFRSLKRDLKFDIKALDRREATTVHRMVYVVLWMYGDTDVAHAGDVVMVWPKIATICDAAAVSEDVAMRSLDWLVANDFIWRIQPERRRGRRPGQIVVPVGGERKTLDRGVAVYALFRDACLYQRAVWAQQVLAVPLDLQGGSSLLGAQEVDIAALKPRIETAREDAVKAAACALASNRPPTVAAEAAIKATVAQADKVTADYLSRKVTPRWCAEEASRRLKSRPETGQPKAAAGGRK